MLSSDGILHSSTIVRCDVSVERCVCLCCICRHRIFKRSGCMQVEVAQSTAAALGGTHEGKGALSLRRSRNSKASRSTTLDPLSPLSSTDSTPSPSSSGRGKKLYTVEGEMEALYETAHVFLFSDMLIRGARVEHSESCMRSFQCGLCATQNSVCACACVRVFATARVKVGKSKAKRRGDVVERGQELLQAVERIFLGGKVTVLAMDAAEEDDEGDWRAPGPPPESPSKTPFEKGQEEPATLLLTEASSLSPPDGDMPRSFSEVRDRCARTVGRPISIHAPINSTLWSHDLCPRGGWLRDDAQVGLLADSTPGERAGRPGLACLSDEEDIGGDGGGTIVPSRGGVEVMPTSERSRVSFDVPAEKLELMDRGLWVCGTVRELHCGAAGDPSRICPLRVNHY
jgi:hypothetical protein